jgi:hypothetical protein
MWRFAKGETRVSPFAHLRSGLTASGLSGASAACSRSDSYRCCRLAACGTGLSASDQLATDYVSLINNLVPRAPRRGRRRVEQPFLRSRR